MEVRVRKMDAAAVKKIDQLAKELKLSREEFLRQQLNTLAFHHFNQEKEKQYHEVILQNMQVMQNCVELMSQVHESIEGLMVDDE